MYLRYLGNNLSNVNSVIALGCIHLMNKKKSEKNQKKIRKKSEKNQKKIGVHRGPKTPKPQSLRPFAP